ncbi:zinc ribbon domain-containing protein [Desulfonema ishimotonii]|uniref:zinc ribbon domain-containing protein n=1 Tax=Desulfonema ishimotonii TaxID=45657 RepID=UPI00140A57BF
MNFGKRIIGVPPHYTSQTCSSCGEVVRKSLSVRTHRCIDCGFVAKCDHNAALNILRIGMDMLQAQT